MHITVIICTANPREDFLSATLDGLRAQTFDQSLWELILVDNNSKVPLLGRVDVSWHPNARIERENVPGLTPARTCGIRNAKGALLIFVDDDNILDRDYLEKAHQIAHSHGSLGAFGGNIIPRYETPPPPWVDRYKGCLALRTVEREVWTNLYDSNVSPWGAGLCVRASVARHYDELLARDPLRRSLDRCGGAMMSNGDVDLAFTAIDCKMGIGLFPQLSLLHLIPIGRLSLEYFIRQMEGHSASLVLLASLRPETAGGAYTIGIRQRFWFLVSFFGQWRSDRLAAKVMQTRFAGHLKGLEILARAKS